MKVKQVLPKVMSYICKFVSSEDVVFKNWVLDHQDIQNTYRLNPLTYKTRDIRNLQARCEHKLERVILVSAKQCDTRRAETKCQWNYNF